MLIGVDEISLIVSVHQKYDNHFLLVTFLAHLVDLSEKSPGLIFGLLVQQCYRPLTDTSTEVCTNGLYATSTFLAVALIKTLDF